MGSARTEKTETMPKGNRWKLEWVDPKTLKPHPDNYKRHPDRQIDALARSIEQYGVYQPVQVSSDGFVLAKHGVVGTAITRCNLPEVPIHRHEFTHDSPKGRGLLVADNTTSEFAEDDDGMKLQHLLALEDEGLLALTGYDERTLATLREEVANAAPPTGYVPEEDPGPGEPPAEPVTRLGDVWVMGDHRLVCGDATQEHVWAALGGERAGRVAFWSPPYALGKSIKLSGNRARSQAGDAYVSGADTSDGWREMMDGMAGMAYAFAEASVVNVQPLAGNKRDLMRWLADNAERLCDIVTWDKQAAAPPAAQGVMASRYEWLVILAGQDATRAVPLSSWRGTLQSVYCAPPQRDNEFAEIHGATFPVHLPLFVLKDLCDKSKAVVDCCMGTGTTLIAAEQSKRQGYGIELEPRYCDATIARWSRMTGKPAVLEATGETFADLSAARDRAGVS